MRYITRRGSLAAAAAIAMTLGGATAANAGTIDAPDTPGSDTVVRVAGTDRIGTAIAASRAQQPTAFAHGAGTVIVTRADGFADALASTPLADELDAPILTTASGRDLDARVEAEIKRLRPAHVVIVGGTAAVSSGAEASLREVVGGANAVVRISGANRYATAATLAGWTIASDEQAAPTAPPDAAEMSELEKWEYRRDTPVFLTTGLEFADALAAGAAAARAGGVVLLTQGDQFDTRSRTGNIHQQSYTFDFMLDEEGGTITGPVYTVGGPATTASYGRYTAYDGADRYETAALVAAAWFPADETHEVAVASGEDYADAVVAAGFIANHDGPLLLTQSDVLPAVTGKYLGAASAGTAERVHVFGGPSAVAEPVVDAISAAIK
ncbi:cell wall-binding repeat-containing protein [Georgenia sp. SYP-B2076]|uniref:cell wall-binding repeat-containing protein n=1 Tax=Georgenia sp. SYP-B2076 TaxID=2495881 RepID=UPI000F8C5C81|nr:cell wall-binding repeat-containing protein [Georgenia sp. SYP-B2076]